VNGAASVSSAGAIAYELLTGRRPSGTGEQIGDLSGESWQSPVRHSSGIARAMHDEAARRYATALGFASALSRRHAPVWTAQSSRFLRSRSEPSPLSPAVIAIDPQRPSTTAIATDSARLRLQHHMPPAPAVRIAAPPIVAAAPIESCPTPAAKKKSHQARKDDDDVAAEREADTAHHRLMAGFEEAEPTLFGEGEEE
jgi:hypothetical protein